MTELEQIAIAEASRSPGFQILMRTLDEFIKEKRAPMPNSVDGTIEFFALNCGRAALEEFQAGIEQTIEEGRRLEQLQEDSTGVNYAEIQSGRPGKPKRA